MWTGGEAEHVGESPTKSTTQPAPSPGGQSLRSAAWAPDPLLCLSPAPLLLSAEPPSHMRVISHHCLSIHAGHSPESQS